MARQPVVACAAGHSSRDNLQGTLWDALLLFLRKDCGYEIKEYGDAEYMAKDWQRLAWMTQSGILALVIIKQEEYVDMHTDAIKTIRQRISNKLPVVVIPDGDKEHKFTVPPHSSHLYAFDYGNGDFTKLLREVNAAWIPPSNRLGADLPGDQDRLRAQLEQIYRSLYLADEERMLGIPDPNSQFVAEALRLDLLPAECRKAELDDILIDPTPTLAPAITSAYLQDQERLRRMSPEEQDDFLALLAYERGLEPCEDGFYRVTRIGYGDKISGFAIDPLTLEYAICGRFGLHHLAAEMLKHRLEFYSYFWHKESKNSHPEERILTGLLYTGLKDFSVPIIQLCLDNANDEGLRRVIRFAEETQLFLLVAYEGYLLE